MNSLLKAGETLDDLQNNYYIIQKEKSFRFGVDAVLLSDFASKGRISQAVDLGSGSGIIPILIYAKRQVKKIIGIEIDADMAEMAQRSVRYNNLQDKIEIIAMDLKVAHKKLGKGKFDTVVTNPPYLKKGSGIVNKDSKQAIARIEVSCTLRDIINTAHQLLLPNGRFYMVHRTDRLVDIVYTMRNLGIEPKKIRFVHSAYNKRPHLLLIEGLKGGRPELKFMEPLYIYDDKGNYTDEINDIYGRVK